MREVIQHESAGSLAAIIVEPIQGRLGNVSPPPGYLKALKQVAHEMGALLIMDETMTCLGRTGKMFAFEYDGIVPDIVIMGKGLGAGYPVTAIASSSMRSWQRNLFQSPVQVLRVLADFLCL
jgi:4-aminobutyrate aminotransferase/4-aminobutyrate aminotransferase/(S)-3-amino-2-methylpropionate transaminase